MLELGKYAGARSDSYATGITSVHRPNPARHEQTDPGAGFGSSQPTDSGRYVPPRRRLPRGHRRRAGRTPPIDVRAPAGISAGCVGFVKLARELRRPQKVTGELASCIGPAGEVWARGFERVGTPVVTCPPCLPGGQNRIQPGGSRLSTASGARRTSCSPVGQPTLEWNVANATSVRIDTIAGPPLLPMTGALPPVGTYTLLR